MTDARTRLLERVVVDVGEHGLGNRSLRSLGEAVGSSHRMLLHHFDSREGLVSAIVESVESAQRDLLAELAAEIDDPGELILALWTRVSSSELLPFVRLFFECVGSSGAGLTTPWLQSTTEIATTNGVPAEEDLIRLGVAVTRGLLVDVLTTGTSVPATRALRRFIDLAFPNKN